MFRSLKRSFRKRNSKRRTSLKGGGISFAAKLGAFMLESVDYDVSFSEKNGFKDSQTQVAGVLPYLHMNISEKQFRNKLNSTHKARATVLAKLCNKKNLNKKLKSVDFDCNSQSLSGVKSVNNSIMDSINNRWGIRKNGQKQIRLIAKYQKWQTSKNGGNKIPPSSVKWCQGL